MRRSKDHPKPEWPPKEYRLPDTLEEIEAGRRERPKQQSLFDQDGREARMEQLTRRT